MIRYSFVSISHAYYILYVIMQMFSARVMALLFLLFDSVAITKPLTSRPASSERYVVCQKIRNLSVQERSQLEDWLLVFRNENTSKCIVVVPNRDVEVLKEVQLMMLKSIYGYIRRINDRHLYIQVRNI